MRCVLHRCTPSSSEQLCVGIRFSGCRLALQYAQQYNAFVEQLAGQGALLAAWQAVLLVAFTRR